MRTGEHFCPGILHAVPAKDGLLMRVRVPGGQLAPNQLHAIASVSTGEIEITSRANIQLRGIASEDLPRIVAELTTAGLLPSRTHERVRNIIASPFAGLDRTELIDTRPLVRELDARLMADPALAAMPPKFSMALDGGGRWFCRETDDLTLRALPCEEGVCFALIIGGTPTYIRVTMEQAVDCILEAARVCLRVAKELELPARGRRIAAVPEAIARMLQSMPFPCPSFSLPEADRAVEAETPIGILSTKVPGFAAIAPSTHLGRMAALQAHRLAAIAADCNIDLRLAPWRGIVLGNIPEDATGRVTAQLREAGVFLDANDGYRGLAGCAGITGCDASLADVRADAVALATQLAGRPTQPGWSVNISGCDKQCAMRNGATAELIATGTGYTLKLHGIARAELHSSASAIDAVTACRAVMAEEVHP
ncbi:MAG TPA: precorrin-3B synthase [Acidobacteriaceae bacterium]|jgi:precorrin-3B synthase